MPVIPIPKRDGVDIVIFDAVKERKAAMDAGDNASGLLASFDVVEE